MKKEKGILDFLKDFYFYASFLVLHEEKDKKRNKRMKKDMKILKEAIKNIEDEKFEKVFSEEMDMEDIFL